MAIQIPSWLKQPKLWSFVCFGSYAVGLLCYALSSTFIHVLGKWTWWKIVLYVIVSSFFCVLYWFAKRWQDNTSSKLGVGLTSLVLTITTICSYISDEKMNDEQPDAYIFVSWSAFAIASLCLSRQIYYGVELDFLNFFCGGIIVLLMKIDLWLFFVGGAITYSLNIVHAWLYDLRISEHVRRSSLDHVVIQVHSDSQENNIEVDADTASAHNTDSALEENSLAQPQEGNSDSGGIIPRFLDCIEALRKENQKLMSMVLEYADKYLKDSGAFDSNNKISVDENLVVDALPSGLIDDLHEMVKLMVEARFEEQCCHVYSSWRRAFLEDCLSTFRFQVEELNIKKKTESWDKAFSVAMRILFPNERRLLDRVFQGFSSAADTSFVEICTELTMRLLCFADTLEGGIDFFADNIPARVLLRLDLLFPNFKLMFEDQFQHSVLLSQVSAVWRISPFKMDIITMIYGDFDKVAQDGGIQPITQKVMRSIFNFYALNTGEWVRAHSSFLFSHTISLIDRLEHHLEAKFEVFRSKMPHIVGPVMGYVYMMNNLSHVEKIAKEPKLTAILGNDWVTKITAKVRQQIELYQISTWKRLLDFLNLDRYESEPVVSAPDIIAGLMKSNLMLFNLNFQATCDEQTRWSIHDMKLWEQVIISLENILLPAHRNFIHRIQNVLGEDVDADIKDKTFQIQDRLSHLFVGYVPMCCPRRRNPMEQKYELRSEQYQGLCNFCFQKREQHRPTMPGQPSCLECCSVRHNSNINNLDNLFDSDTFPSPLWTR